MSGIHASHVMLRSASNTAKYTTEYLPRTTTCMIMQFQIRYCSLSIPIVHTHSKHSWCLYKWAQSNPQPATLVHKPIVTTQKGNVLHKPQTVAWLENFTTKIRLLVKTTKTSQVIHHLGVSLSKQHTKSSHRQKSLHRLLSFTLKSWTTSLLIFECCLCMTLTCKHWDHA